MRHDRQAADGKTFTCANSVIFIYVQYLDLILTTPRWQLPVHACA
jgi:hypothetical protein